MIEYSDTNSDQLIDEKLDFVQNQSKLRSSGPVKVSVFNQNEMNILTIWRQINYYTNYFYNEMWNRMNKMYCFLLLFSEFWIIYWQSLDNMVIEYLINELKYFIL